MTAPEEPAFTPSRPSRPPAWTRLALVLAVLIPLGLVAAGIFYVLGLSPRRPARTAATTPVGAAPPRAPAPSGAGPGAVPPRLSLPPLLPGHPRVSLPRAGHRPVVLNFFASWCGPCKQELPLLARAARHEHGRIAFVGVDVNDNAAHARQLVRTSGVRYPVGQDPQGRAATRYGLLGLPTTVFIGADGRVARAVSGQLTPAALDHWLHALSRAK